MFSLSDLHTECECKALCCVGIILRQRNTIQLRCFVTMQLFHWLLSQTKRPAFLQFSLLSFFCLSPPPKNKETYTVILNGEKTTARVRPNPFLFEILNSIYHPRARSSSTLSLLPCWGEQRGFKCGDGVIPRRCRARAGTAQGGLCTFKVSRKKK